MIDLTPLDVRKKRGDFGKSLRGYDPGEVDTFLELVAERLEELVKENLTFRERVDRLQEQVSAQTGRENAVQEALVTAQELRKDVGEQARREADMIRKEAERDAERIVADAERGVRERREALEELERKRLRFLRAFRGLLERELDVVAVEEGRTPLEDVAVELELGGGRGAGGGRGSRRAGAGEGSRSEWSEPSDPPPLTDAPSARTEGAPDEPGDGAVEPLPDLRADVHELASQVDSVFGGYGDGDDGAAGAPGDVVDPAEGPARRDAGELWLPSLLDDETEEEEASGEPRPESGE